MLRSKFVIIACMLMLSVGVANAATIQVDVQLNAVNPQPLPPGTKIQFFSDNNNFDVFITPTPPFGSPVASMMETGPSPDSPTITSFFDVFVNIEIPGSSNNITAPGIYSYCIGSDSSACSEVGVQGQLDVVTPLPAALPLFATGLGGLGLLGWRRKRKVPTVA